MKISFLRTTFAIFLTAILFPVAVKSQDNISLKVSLDSAYILMGKQTSLHVEIFQPGDAPQGYLLLPADTLVKEVEISSIGYPDTIKGATRDQLMQIRQDIIIQSFDSGLYSLPPLAYLLENGDTIFSNATTLKVVPVNVDTLSTIHSFAPVSSIGSKWWDFLPDILIEYWIYCIIIILIVLGGIAAWLLLKKKVNVPFMPKTKPVSPYDAAISSLARLKEEHLCENGREKEYYTRLTDILRQYLEGRFGINAMEMTSTQILDELKNRSDISEHHGLMKRILEIADFVKFAKVRPLPDDNVASWSRAQKFVEDTKPAPEPEEKEEDQNGEKEVKK
ncbi:MAG: cell wall anchor protein [Muribaculaceae bacterium]|nr:cell wall anchor protein [Muribaculaceae bacterium]